MSNEEYSVNLMTDSKEIIASGTVFQFENENVIIKIDDINIKMGFEDDGNKKPALIREYQDGKNVKFRFINYDSKLGVGLSKPIYLGKLDNRDFYFICRASNLGDSTGNRMINYTFYWEKINGSSK